MVSTHTAVSGQRVIRDTSETASARRILFLDHTAALGGGEIALLHLVRALDKSRYTPVVVLFADGPLTEKLREARIETHILPLSPRVAKTSKDALGASVLLRGRDVAETLGYVFRLARFLRAQGADLVHTNSLKSDLIGGLAARLARIPLLWHVRDRIASDYLPDPVAAVFRRLCRILPGYILANSDATFRTVFPTGGADKFARVVHDGVPVETLSDDTQVSEESSPVPCEIPQIGLVGRISPWKGQHIFLQAAVRVHQQYPQARFQIIGAALFDEQAYEQEVRALASSLGLDECVEFTGFRSDIPALISGLDILVHASTSGEPFGQVIVEGMAAAKPVVATRGGGVPEIVMDGETGLLVPMSDADAMAGAILSLLSDPLAARRMGRAGRRRVGEHFTTALTARRVESVYAQMLCPHSSR